MRNTQNHILKSIVIDDSSLQRVAIIKFIKEHSSLTLIGEYNNGINARESLKEKIVDLVFLDVEMPIINGFELLETLDDLPQIIITSSNPGYALKAFDYNVTDYLLKPFSKERFNEAIKRVITNFEANHELETDEDYIYVNSNLKKNKIFIKDINWIEGLGDYIKIITDNSSILVLSTMKAFLTRLPMGKFLRIHKSYIVNLEKVNEFNTSVVEICGHRLPLSRLRRDELEEALLNQ